MPCSRRQLRPAAPSSATGFLSGMHAVTNDFPHVQLIPSERLAGFLKSEPSHDAPGLVTVDDSALWPWDQAPPSSTVTRSISGAADPSAAFLM